jgi:chaperonin cofactor prefoldin
MQIEYFENPQESKPSQQESGSAKAGGSQGGPGGPGGDGADDFTRMKNWIQQVCADSERARVIAEQTREDLKDIRWELEDHGRKTRRSSWTTLVVALALVAACAYGYYKFQNDSALLAEFPAVQKALSAVGQRVNAAEGQIRSWSGDWDGMNSRLAKVEKSAGATLRSARDFAMEQAAKVQHELQAELDHRSQSMDADVSKLESAQQKDQEEIAQLQGEISDVRSETLEQLAQSKQESGRVMGDLQSSINRNRDDFDVMARSLDRQRLDFEVNKDQTFEIAPGLTLTVSNTNVSYQRIEGRLHVIPDGRILWIRGQGIQQPVRFYTAEDERPYEVVFTRVLKDAAVGYVLAPTQGQVDAASTELPTESSVASSSGHTQDLAQVQ